MWVKLNHSCYFGGTWRAILILDLPLIIKFYIGLHFKEWYSGSWRPGFLPESYLWVSAVSLQPSAAHQQGSGSAVGPLVAGWSVSLISSLLPDVMSQQGLHHM